jgi:hypothetical protein
VSYGNIMKASQAVLAAASARSEESQVRWPPGSVQCAAREALRELRRPAPVAPPPRRPAAADSRWSDAARPLA